MKKLKEIKQKKEDQRCNNERPGRPKTQMQCIIVLFIACLVFQPLNAQDKKRNSMAGARISADITGNGNGLLCSPQLLIGHNKYQWYAGPIFQRSFTNLSGLTAGMEYSVFVPPEQIPLEDSAEFEYPQNIELFVFFKASYQPGGLLARSTIKIEEKVNPEYYQKLDQLKLSSAEAYSGFGIRIKLGEYLKWTGSIGLGGFISNFSGYDLYKERSGIGISVQTGLNFKFWNRSTK